MNRLAIAVLVAMVASCGGPSAEGPLTVTVGMARDRLPAELHRFEYCQRDEPQADTEVFPRCDSPGVEFGQSWVVAHYDNGRVVRIQRWERFAEEGRGVERFNTLVEKRSALVGPPDPDAKRQVAGQQELPKGTKTWVAFRAGDRSLVGVYLLEPSPPEYASVLEEIVELRSDVAPATKAERGCTDCAPAD